MDFGEKVTIIVNGKKVDLFEFLEEHEAEILEEEVEENEINRKDSSKISRLGTTKDDGRAANRVPHEHCCEEGCSESDVE